MLNKVMGADFFADDENLGYRAMEPDTEVPSHMTLSTDEDGTPTLARFTYVDEDTCIGCKNCAFVARSTFFMEESFAGKARVYNQGGDSEELIDEAIDSCPVNCIHYVAHEDLVTLETERLAREDNLDFNNYASFKRGWTGQEVAVPETQAKYYGSLAMGTRCNNCPSRGCASCPMFGVGKNPIYLQRAKAREEKKIASGAAQREKADKRAAERIDTIYADGEYAGAAAAAAANPFDDDAFNALFDEGYSFDALEDAARPPPPPKASSSALAVDVESKEAAEALRAALEDEQGVVSTLDPYAVLGVKRDASVAEVKRAFRRLALRWHPDRCTQLPELERLQAELIFKQINLANEVTSSPSIPSPSPLHPLSSPSPAHVQVILRARTPAAAVRKRSQPPPLARCACDLSGPVKRRQAPPIRRGPILLRSRRRLLADACQAHAGQAKGCRRLDRQRHLTQGACQAGGGGDGHQALRLYAWGCRGVAVRR